jgi:hypothetical protein
MKLLAVNLIIGLTLLALAGGCASQNDMTPPPSAQNPPIYPDAEQKVVRNIPGVNNIPTQIISYRTRSKPEDVLEFYKGVLLKDDWRVRKSYTFDGLHFDWVAGCPIYGLDVVIKSRSIEYSEIEQKLTAELCY